MPLPQAVLEKARRVFRDDHSEPPDRVSTLSGSGGINFNSLAMNEASIRKLHVAGGAGGGGG